MITPDTLPWTLAAAATGAALGAFGDVTVGVGETQHASYPQAVGEAIDECGAPVVSIAGGEPLLHRDMPRIVEGYLARKKYVILCTNALLLKKKIDDFKPNPGFTW